MKEIWKNVNGYNGLYQVSNLGRVKSLLKYGEEKILSSGLSSSGYYSVVLYKNKKRRTHNIHRLVIEAFISNPENKKAVNHKDGIKKNNHLSNLEWCTFSENTRHALNNNLNSWSGYPVFQIKNGFIVKVFKSAYQAEKITGINNSNINACCKNKRKTAGKYEWQYATRV
jgi:hypothetical protein